MFETRDGSPLAEAIAAARRFVEEDEMWVRREPESVVAATQLASSRNLLDELIEQWEYEHG